MIEQSKEGEKAASSEQVLSFTVFELWQKTLSIKNFMMTFKVNVYSLMKFTLLLMENHDLKISIREIRNLTLTEEDMDVIILACGGRRPTSYTASFKLARKASELIQHVLMDEEVFGLVGISQKDRDKKIVITAVKSNAAILTAKRDCRWHEYCCKIVLMREFKNQSISCVQCPRRDTNELKTTDVWLLGSATEGTSGWSFDS